MAVKKTKVRRISGGSWKSFWSWIAYVFIAAVGITFIVEGFLIQSSNIMTAFLEYFIGIILLGSSIKRIKL